MKRFLKRGLSVLLCLLLALGCALPAMAVSPEESDANAADIVWSRAISDGTVIEEIDAGGNYYFHCPEDCKLANIIGYFRNVYGLNEDNFAFSFYCPDTGEYYAYNDMNFMHAASTYKLPLNMYYYDQEAAGVYDGDTYVGGYDLDEAHYLSIVWSDNYVSESMIYYLGSYRDYKQLMNENYGQIAEEDLDERYWSANYYCTRFMLNTLKFLYDHMWDYWELIGYMVEAAPGEDLNIYSGSVPVAHKVGEYQSHFNDVAITFTRYPYLVAVYTDGISDPGEVMGRLNAALIAYQNGLEQTDPLETAEDMVFEADMPA